MQKGQPRGCPFLIDSVFESRRLHRTHGVFETVYCREKNSPDSGFITAKHLCGVRGRQPMIQAEQRHLSLVNREGKHLPDRRHPMLITKRFAAGAGIHRQSKQREQSGHARGRMSKVGRENLSCDGFCCLHIVAEQEACAQKRIAIGLHDPALPCFILCGGTEEAMHDGSPQTDYSGFPAKNQ